MKFYGAYGEVKTGTMDNYKRVMRPERSIPVMSRRGRNSPVVKVDITGKVLARYGSVSLAAKAAGISQPSMSVRIKNKTKAEGCYWRFAE